MDCRRDLFLKQRFLTGFIAIGRAGCPFCVLLHKLLRSALANCFFFLRVWRFVLGWARSCKLCATVFRRPPLIRQPASVSSHPAVSPRPSTATATFPVYPAVGRPPPLSRRPSKVWERLHPYPPRCLRG